MKSWQTAGIVLAVIAVLVAMFVWGDSVATISIESTSTSTKPSTSKRVVPPHAGNVFIYVVAKPEAPTEEDVSVFNHRRPFRLSEISYFVETKDGIELHLGKGEVIVESFLDYEGKSEEYSTIAWNGKGTIPLVRYPTGNDGKRHKVVLDHITTQIYNPKFPEYEHFQKLEPYRTFYRKVATKGKGRRSATSELLLSQSSSLPRHLSHPLLNSIFTNLSN